MAPRQLQELHDEVGEQLLEAQLATQSADSALYGTRLMSAAGGRVRRIRRDTPDDLLRVCWGSWTTSSLRIMPRTRVRCPQCRRLVQLQWFNGRLYYAEHMTFRD